MKKYFMRSRFIRKIAVGAVVGTVALSSLALAPAKAFADGLAGNVICQMVCQSDTSSGKAKCKAQPCKDPTSGTSGFCDPATNQCHATKAGDGSTLAGIGSLLSGIAALITAMKGTPAAATAAAAPITSPYGYGCPSGTYTVTAPSTDPCAVYQPTSSVSTSLVTPTTSSSAGADLAAMLGGAGTALTDALGGVTNTNDNSAGVSTGGMTSLPTASSTNQTPIQPQGNGVHGDIKIDLNGATAFASNQDLANNQTVAAFYGSEALNADPGAVAAQMCQMRPWATNFLASVAPPAFFDGLCNLHGFKVGMPVVTPAKVTPAPAPKPAAPVATTTAATSTPVGYTGPNVPPQVQIWAVPTSVPLGSRTSVFWSSQGVYNCTVTSPDGSFNQNTTSGGASTVPLSSNTTFTISCLKPDNTPDTAFTTVKLSM